MPREQDEETSRYKKWCLSIKADKICEVLDEAKEIKISEEKSLECLVYISQLAYKDAQSNEPFRSPPNDIAKLTQIFSSSVISQPSLCNLRFISSLYHIAFFFYSKDHLECLKQVFKIILETKKTNNNTFYGEGSKVYEGFILLLKKVISKLASNDDLPFDRSVTKEFLCFFLDFLVVNNEVENGSTFLDSVLYFSQIIGKENRKSAIVFISKSLQLFSAVNKFKDVDSTLTMMFKLFSSLFHYQVEETGYASALDLVLSYVDLFKWKFSEEHIRHGECFYLISRAKMFTSSQTETGVRKLIDDANIILRRFENSREKRDFLKEACLLFIYLVTSLNNSKKINSSVLLDSCLEPFLEMMINLYYASVGFITDKHHYVYCFGNILFLISETGLTKKHILKESFKTILKAEKLVFEEARMMRSENNGNADCYTKIALTRTANLIRSYHLADLFEEEIALSIPFCKFVFTLPPYIFEDSPSRIAMNLAFSCLAIALGQKQLLYDALEVATAWLIFYPKSVAKVFKCWGDVKHNAFCAGGNEFLDTTIFTIVTKGKKSLEEKWLPCNLTSAELGNYLVKELNTYYINSVLRGSPVMEAARTLELVATDDLTQARGLVVALDVTTANSEYAEHCHHYLDRSKLLMSALRKQKKDIDPVDYNCCMGELLFCQFRYKLKSFRSQCEGEVLRLSALHETAPLVSELPEDRPDPDDTCDVTTRYANLSLEKQQELLADLQTAVAHWKTACTCLTEKKGSRKKGEKEDFRYDLTVTLKNLQEAAFIMKLYCDEVKEGEFWNLLYNLALLADNKEGIVNAVGEMLMAKDKVDPAAVTMAEGLFKSSEIRAKIQHTFTLHKVFMYLQKNKIAEGIKILRKETEEMKNLSSMVSIYCHIILGFYQKLDMWAMYRDMFSISPSCHFSFQKALGYLLYYVQKENWNSLIEASNIQLRLIQVSQELGEVNWSLEQPREARCFLRSQLSVAQKLGLPVRTAQLLLLLAWVDLSTGMWADCAVKLEGLEALLELRGAPDRYIAGAVNRNRLSKEEVWAPEFLEHSAGCDCFVCCCVEYQRLVLETLTLRATYCANNDRMPLAVQSFKVAFKVHQVLNRYPDVQVQVSSSRMWKHYADVLALSGKPQDALSANKKAFDCLPSHQKPTTLLQQLLHQKTSLDIIGLTAHCNKPIKPRVVIETEETTSAVKTPVVKRGEPLPVPVKTPLTEVIPNITPKYVRPVRKFALPSSGDENTPPPQKSSPHSSRRIKPTQKFTIETPQSIAKMRDKIKTPFTIFGDDGEAVEISSSKVRSRVKKKTDIRTNDVDPVHKKLFSSNDVPSKKSDVPVIFKSPVRKSNRKPNARTTVKSKLVNDDILKIPESSSKKQNASDESVFSFEELKQEVSQIKKSITKSTYGKSSSKVAQKNNGTVEPKPVEVDSDCSIVEGTPTPPGSRKVTFRSGKPRRVTRSNKT